MSILGVINWTSEWINTIFTINDFLRKALIFLPFLIPILDVLLNFEILISKVCLNQNINILPKYRIPQNLLELPLIELYTFQ